MRSERVGPRRARRTGLPSGSAAVRSAFKPAPQRGPPGGRVKTGGARRGPRTPPARAQGPSPEQTPRAAHPAGRAGGGHRPRAVRASRPSWRFWPHRSPRRGADDAANVTGQPCRRGAQGGGCPGRPSEAPPVWPRRACGLWRGRPGREGGESPSPRRPSRESLVAVTALDPGGRGSAGFTRCANPTGLMVFLHQKLSFSPRDLPFAQPSARDQVRGAAGDSLLSAGRGCQGRWPSPQGGRCHARILVTQLRASRTARLLLPSVPYLTLPCRLPFPVPLSQAPETKEAASSAARPPTGERRPAAGALHLEAAEARRRPGP